MSDDWCEFRPPASSSVVCSPHSAGFKLWSSIRARCVWVFFLCLCHLEWAQTLITPDRFLQYRDVKTTRLYPLVSIKFLLISWQLWDYIKTDCELKRGSEPGARSLFSFLYSWPACSPFHLPPTFPSRASSLRLLGALARVSIINEPFLDIRHFVLCAGGVWK